MNKLSRIKLPNGKVYTFKGETYFISGKYDSSTQSLIGDLPSGVDSYYHGLTIDYFLSQYNAFMVKGLNLGNLGIKPIYVSDNNTLVIEQIKEKSLLRLTYIVDSSLNSGNGCWKILTPVFSELLEVATVDEMKEYLNI